MDGWFHTNSVVQDYQWKGGLVVIQYVAENDEEVVAECMGQDESGRMITQFLVVDKSWFGGRVGHRFLPKALDMEWYSPQGHLGNDVPIPYFSFPSVIQGFQSLHLVLIVSLLVFPSFIISSV